MCLMRICDHKFAVYGFFAEHSFVQPSVAKMGGITELRKVFPIAAVRNVTLMPHCFYGGPGLLSVIHATAALGTADAMVEWRYFDLEAQVYGGTLAPTNGRISVPQRPGLGLAPDPHVVRDYLRADTDRREQRATIGIRQRMKNGTPRGRCMSLGDKMEFAISSFTENTWLSLLLHPSCHRSPAWSPVHRLSSGGCNH